MRLLYVFLIFINISILHAQTWTQLSNIGLPGGLANAATFSNSSYGFLCTGNNDVTEFDSLWRFDPLLNSWSRMANFPGASRKNTAYFQIDSIAYVGIGSQGATNYYNDFYAYNMNQNTWSAIANYPGLGRRITFSGSVNGKGYVAGGIYGSNPLRFASDFWEYDPSANTWTQITTFPLGGRASGISFAYGNEIYFGLGHNGTIDFNDLWAFNTVTRLWSQKTSFPGVARILSSCSVSNGFALVGGGIELGIVLHLNDYYLYDAVNNTWSSTLSFLNGGKSGANAFAIGNNYYLGGGRDRSTSISDDLWEYSNSTSFIENIVNARKVSYIFPNPNHGSFRLKSNLNQVTSVRIYSTEGRLILQEQISMEDLNLDFDLNPGLYFIKIQDDFGNSYSDKLIIN